MPRDHRAGLVISGMPSAGETSTEGKRKQAIIYEDPRVKLSQEIVDELPGWSDTNGGNVSTI